MLTCIVSPFSDVLLGVICIASQFFITERWEMSDDLYWLERARQQRCSAKGCTAPYSAKRIAAILDFAKFGLVVVSRRLLFSIKKAVQIDCCRFSQW
jgi:hypothetical protein